MARDIFPVQACGWLVRGILFVMGDVTSDISLGMIVIRKTMESEGDIVLEIDCSEEISIWEEIGMLTMALDRARTEASMYLEEEDDDN